MTDTNTQSEVQAKALDNYGRSMRFGVLGPIEVTEKGRRFVLGGPKQRTVLALLIANAGKQVSTDSLMQGVYGDDAPNSSRRSIQTYVSNLRGELGDAISSTNTGYVLEADRSQVDAFAFEDAVAAAAEFDDAELSSSRLRDALDMWRGHPYADIDGHAAISAETVRLNETRGAAIEARIQADLDLGRHRDLVAELESLTEEYPLREGLRGQHMLALYRAGRQAEALRAYERTRTYLVNEMGLDPSPELRELERRMLEQDVTLGLDLPPAVKSAAIVVADVADPRSLSTTDLGEREALIERQSDAIAAACSEFNGSTFAHRGSAVFASFHSPEDAVRAVTAIQGALAPTGDAMRIAISSGDTQVDQDGTVSGPPVTRAVQLVAIAHGGQVLLSPEANQSLAESGGAGWTIRSLGSHVTEETDQERMVYQLILDGLPVEFPPLRIDGPTPAMPTATRGLPGYELRDAVGAGAFGVVHKAYQPSVGRQVAIKIIRPEYANDPHFIRRFEVEAQLVARLEHPHIVPLYDYWRNPDGAYLVMRWFGSGSLKDRLGRGPLSLAQADALVAQAGAALEFAHRSGIAHRDLKASNILLDDESMAYLGDFGIARMTPSEDAISGDVRDFTEVIRASLGSSPDPAVAVALDRASAARTMAEFMEMWLGVVGPDTESAVAAQQFTETRNPYKGLQAFGESDADDFHGRDEEIAEIVDTLTHRRMVAVVGPSGIGKSSLVRAGVVPALRNGAISGSEEWFITDILPGVFPFEELATSLLRVATEMPSDLESELKSDPRGLVRAVHRHLPADATLLLIVDQFEELFTQAAPEDRDAFLSLVAATAADERSRVKILVTVRADFFDRPLRFADLGTALREGTVPIAAPDADSLTSIVTEPAKGVGVSFETGLVPVIVSDVEGQPGALPLLEFALTEMFNRRSTDSLTSAGYAEIGGVRGALGSRAESIFESLDEQGQNAARESFLRMVTVSDGARSTRRRVRRSDLERLDLDPAALQSALAAFGADRLITFDRDPITRGPTVEVAHEALLREWSRLADWIDDYREDLLLRSRLTAIASDWEASDRDATYLLSRGRLHQHEAWTATTGLALSTSESEILTESRTAQDEAAAARRNRRRLVMAGFGAAALIALVLAVGALLANAEAQRQREEATNQAGIAEENLETAQTNEARAAASEAVAAENLAMTKAEREASTAQTLVASAAAVIGDDPELALLLATVGASRLPDDIAALGVVRRAMSSVRTLLSYPWTADADVRSVWGDLNGDGSLLAVGGNPSGTLVMLDVDSGEELWRFVPIPDEADRTWTNAEFVYGGDKVIVSVELDPFKGLDPPDRLGLYLLDARTGEVDRFFDVGMCGGHLNEMVSANKFALLNVSSQPNVESNGCGVDDNGGEDIDVISLDLETGEIRTILEGMNGARGDLWSVALRDDGVAAFVDTNRTLHEVIVLDTGEVLMSVEGTHGPTAALSPDGELVVSGGSSMGGAGFAAGRTLTVREIATGNVVATLPGHAGGSFSARFTTDSRLLITGGEDGAVRVWNPRDGLQVDVFVGAGASMTEVGVSDDGGRIVGFSFDGVARVYSRHAVDFVEGGSYDACDGEGLFNATQGVTVRRDRLLTFSVCPDDEMVHVIDMASGETIRSFVDLAGQNQDLSPDGTLVAAQGTVPNPDAEFPDVSTVEVINVESGEVVRMDGLCTWLDAEGDGPGCGSPPDPYVAYAWDLDFSSDGTMLGLGLWFGASGQVWNPATGESLALFQADSIEFSDDSSRLISTDFGSGLIELRDTSDWSVVASVPLGGDLGLKMHRFNPDGSEIVSAILAGFGAGDIIFHDGNTLEELRRIVAPHEAGIRDLDLSSDGKLIATAGQAGFVKIWDFATGDLVQDILVARDDRVNAVVFTNNDTELLVTVSSGPIIVVPLERSRVLAAARARISRGFTEFECDLYFSNGACPTLEEITAG